MLQYYVVDVESTGLKAKWHEVNQISVLRCHDGAIATKRIAVKFPKRASIEALNVQGITIEDLSKGEPREEVIPFLNKFMQEDDTTPEHRCIIAHNASFDRRFSHAEWAAAGIDFPAHLWLCTQKMSRAYAKKTDPFKIAAAQRKIDFRVKKDKPKFGLNLFMKGIGLEPKKGAHDAVVDTINTKELFDFIMASGKIDHVSLIERQPHRKEKVKELDMDDF